MNLLKSSCISRLDLNFFPLLKVTEIGDVVRSLSNGRVLWKDIETKYPKFEQQEAK